MKFAAFIKNKHSRGAALLITLVILWFPFQYLHGDETVKNNDHPNIFEMSLVIKASPHDVWDTLFDVPATKHYYLCPASKLEKNKGGAINYGDGLIEGTVTSLETGKVFEHTFRFTESVMGKTGLPETHVRYEMTEIQGNTFLTLTHRDLPDSSEYYESIRQGWVIILSALKSYLETGKGLTE